LEDRNAIRAWGALESLRALGSEAAGAIPELVRLLGSTNESVCVKAANALGAIGTKSIPVFLDLLTNQAFSGRMREIALGNGWRSLGTNSRTAVPVLIDHLRDGDGEVARSSAWLLGTGGVEPKTAVPALVDALSRTNSSVRWSAVWALRRFRPYVNVAPYLVGSLSDPDPSIRETATNLLRQIAPEVLSPAVIPGPYR
jgi:HEAT repeat protein